MKPEPSHNTSPPTPPFRDEPWRAYRPPPLPADLQTALDELKAKLHTGPGMTVLESTARAYLQACRERRGQEDEDNNADVVPF